MPSKSRFSSAQTNYVPTGRVAKSNTIFDFRGLDYTNPYDLIQKGRTPFAKNFRLYDEDDSSRRVAISTRKGSAGYTEVLNEAADASNVVTTGAANKPVDKLLEWKAMPFTATTTGHLSKVELNVRKGNGQSALIVEVWTDDGAGLPGTKLTDSSILPSAIDATYGYKAAHFVDSPAITSGQKYWIVAYIQDDGAGAYEWASNTASALAKTSNSGASGFTATSYSLNFKAYTAANTVEKGGFRFNQEGGTNRTMVVYGTTLYAVDDNDGTFEEVQTGLSTDASEYSWTIADGKLFWVNGYDDLKAWDGTTVETITDTELPILSMITFHRDRLIGVVAAEPNKLVFSEAPGNPSDLPADEQWYYAWLSIGFIYVPAPKVADPIMAIVSFQDVLKIVTTNSKYDLYGYDPDSYTLRQSTGKKGAISKSILADESFLYFVGNDGFYRHNGSSDELISDLIQPVFENIAFPENINIAKWKRQIRFYFGANGSANNTDCLLFHTVYEEWQHDTEVFAKRGIVFTDADDDGRLVETSSIIPQITRAEVDYNNFGRAIDFAYWTRYDSLGMPAQRKRLLKYFPLFEPVGRAFTINVDMDKDRSNVPVHNQVTLTVTGALWGAFEWGDGTVWGDTTKFKPQKLRYPGYAYYWQMRISRRAISNPVMFFGVQYSYKAKRL